MAYAGSKPCRDLLLDGLSHLEYRGYDSAGLVCIDAKHNHFSYHKEAGGLSPIKRLAENTHFDGYIGMGHMRWATHGVVDIKNAHPHFNCNRTLAVVHNGVIEGYEVLRDKLLSKGHNLASSTDSEIVVHHLNDHVEELNDLKAAACRLVKEINGAYALLFMLEQFPNTILAIRHRSPLIIGVGDDETYVASDMIAFSHRTNNVVFMPDDSFALITKNSIELYNFDGNPVPYYLQTIDPRFSAEEKDFFDQPILRDVYEQKYAINRTIAFCKIIGSYSGRSVEENLENTRLQSLPLEYNDSIWRQLGLSKEKIKHATSLTLIGVGSSWHAASLARYFFEIQAKIPTYVFLSSEFRYAEHFRNPQALTVVISQSGETKDTLESLRLINAYEEHTIAITNVASSSMVREASGFLPMQAGPELSSASIKAFSTQVATLYWLANRMALDRGTISAQDMYEAEESLYIAAEVLEAIVDVYKFKISQEIAPILATYKNILVLGRHVSYPLAQEAAMKFKEIAHMNAHAYNTGEFKTGPIFITNSDSAVILFSVLNDVMYPKLLACAKDIKARGAKLIVFAFESQHELLHIADYAFSIPRVTPLLGSLAMNGLMHFLVYQVSRFTTIDIQRPSESLLIQQSSKN
jgi:glutamine---fructose-6-phosphate transaminase (isomerizing)